MATRTISTRIALEGEQEFKRQMGAVNSELKTLGTEMQYVEAQFKGQERSVEALTEKDRILRKEIEQQQEKVKALEQAVEDAADAYGDADNRTDRYRQQLNRAKTELVKMEAAQKDVADSLEAIKKEGGKAAAAIEDVGDAADKSGGAMGGLENSLGKVKGALAGAFTVAAAKELADGLVEIEENTREYRRSASMLEATSESLGYSTGQTAEAYNYLMGIMGDGQAANTAVANLQALQVPQEKLMELIQGTAGAQVKWQSSIDVTSLSQSISETIRSGQVTGQFADVLNLGTKEGERFGVTLRENTTANEDWNKAVNDAKTAEDFFNLALQETESQAERTQLVIDAMAGQGLPTLEKAWRDNNEAIVTANLEQDEWEKALARVGEFVAPAAATLKSFGADSINWLIDRMEDLIDVTNDAWEALGRGEFDERQQRMAAQRGYDVSTRSGLATLDRIGGTMDQMTLAAQEKALRDIGVVPGDSSIPAYMREATAAMQAIANQHNNANGGLGHTLLEISVNLDGNKLGETALPYLQAAAGRQGESMIG